MDRFKHSQQHITIEFLKHIWNRQFFYHHYLGLLVALFQPKLLLFSLLYFFFSDPPSEIQPRSMLLSFPDFYVLLLLNELSSYSCSFSITSLSIWLDSLFSSNQSSSQMVVLLLVYFGFNWGLWQFYKAGEKILAYSSKVLWRMQPLDLRNSICSLGYLFINLWNHPQQTLKLGMNLPRYLAWPIMSRVQSTFPLFIWFIAHSHSSISSSSDKQLRPASQYTFSLMKWSALGLIMLRFCLFFPIMPFLRQLVLESFLVVSTRLNQLYPNYSGLVFYYFYLCPFIYLCYLLNFQNSFFYCYQFYLRCLFSSQAYLIYSFIFLDISRAVFPRLFLPAFLYSFCILSEFFDSPTNLFESSYSSGLSSDSSNQRRLPQASSFSMSSIILTMSSGWSSSPLSMT